MNSIRAEADQATLRAERAEEQVKKLQQDLLKNSHDMNSLIHQSDLKSKELEEAELKLKKYKQDSEEAEHFRSTKDSLERKVALLEEELDTAEKNLKDTVDKCAAMYLAYLVYADHHAFWYRLRQVDVKAEHFERQLQRAEQERDAWEKKYEVCLSPALSIAIVILINGYPLNANLSGFGSQISQIAERVGRLGGEHAGSVILSHELFLPFMILSSSSDQVFHRIQMYFE